MKKKLKFLFIAVIACLLIIFAKMSVFQTKNLIDIPLLFILLIVALIFFVWFNYLGKKDKDEGFM